MNDENNAIHLNPLTEDNIDQTHSTNIQSIEMDHGINSWLAVAASWLVHFVVLGIPSSYGVFQEYYVSNPESYHGNHSAFSVSMIGAVVNCSLGLYGLPSGRLTDIFGNHIMTAVGGILVGMSLLLASFSVSYWQLIITQGVLFGLACPIAFYPALTIINHHFSVKKGIATGMAVSGSGIGGLVFSPLMRFLVTRYNSSWTLFVLAFMGFCIIILSSIFLKPRLPPASRGEMRYRLIICDPAFVRLFLIAIFSSMGYFVPYIFIPSFAVYNGMSALQGSIALGLMNGASAIGRITLGAVSDGFGHLNTLLLCQVIASVAIIVVWPFSLNFGCLIFFALMYGFFIGGHISMLPIVIADIFGTNNIATLTGMVYTGFFFGNLLGPPLCGYMIDTFTITNNQTSEISINFLPAILFGGISILISSFILLYSKLQLSSWIFCVKV